MVPFHSKLQRSQLFYAFPYHPQKLKETLSDNQERKYWHSHTVRWKKKKNVEINYIKEGNEETKEGKSFLKKIPSQAKTPSRISMCRTDQLPIQWRYKKKREKKENELKEI